VLPVQVLIYLRSSLLRCECELSAIHSFFQSLSPAHSPALCAALDRDCTLWLAHSRRLRATALSTQQLMAANPKWPKEYARAHAPLGLCLDLCTSHFCLLLAACCLCV
jgi:hypothetical protein